ncbi:hypothetical protein [Aggregatibacter kilianii]|uniref:hypothetical protein n=1 Tax=Aggregatibacter kilianii TaxID=2025884 RepID=UPI000D642DC9|nr:hypothetical protein [Aggregatibacter kilianii]
MARGILTYEIMAKSKELLGYEITQEELRLMPYIQYCVLNDQNIEPFRVNSNERKILTGWRYKDYISAPSSDLKISKFFYDAICELLWMGYVASVERDKE